MHNYPYINNHGHAKRLGRFVIGATAATSIGCVCLAAAGNGRSLTASELQHLLSNGAEFREVSPYVGTDARRREFFYPNGRYIGCADRAEIEGRHFIDGNRLCVQVGANRSTCRLVTAEDAGAFSQHLIGRNGKAGPPLSVKISSIPEGDNCLKPEAAL